MTNITGFTRHLALKDMGEALLAIEIQERAAESTWIREGDVEAAIRVAALVHMSQTRANRGNLPRDTYLTHPLRNALRLMRYGVTDASCILAAILHDTVEDGADFIVHTLAGYTVDSRNGEAETRQLALRWLETEFEPEVVRLILNVSNPLLITGFPLSKAKKRESYIGHVRWAIKDAKTCVVKLTDFVDNAVGLYHNTGMSNEAQIHLARKYYPLVDLFGERIASQDVIDLLTPAGFREAVNHILKGEAELSKILVDDDGDY